MGEREEFGCSFSKAWFKPLLHMKFCTSDLRRIWVTIHRFATQIPHIYSSNHPQNLCYVFIIKNNYGPTLPSSRLKSLGTASGKLSPHTWSSLFHNQESKWPSLWTQIIRVWAQGLAVTQTPLLLSLCHVFMSPKKGNPKKLPVQVRKSGFADIGWSNSPWLSNIIKGLQFCFDLF